MPKEKKSLKESLYHIFVWISGSDPTILERCDRFEHIKHAGFGALILIPTTMAFISMPFAISMLGTPWLYCILIGSVWAGIVFVIDRSMVSNMKKGGNNVWMSTGAFILRFIFAAALGFVISDPLVLRLFEPTINEVLTEKEKDDRLRLEAQFDSLIVLENERVDSFRTQVIKPAELKKDFFLQLFQWERNGLKRSAIYEGIEYTTSGIGSIGDRARRYGQAYDNEQEVVNSLIERMDSLKVQAQNNIAKLKANKQEEVAKLNNALSRDYLTRAKYLHKISAEDESIFYRKWFLIIFLIFVDIIPVLFKAILRPSQYDSWVSQSEQATHEVAQNFYKVDIKDKELFINSVSDFRRREMIRIFKEDNDDRPLGERLDELQRLTDLKWGE